MSRRSLEETELRAGPEPEGGEALRERLARHPRPQREGPSIPRRRTIDLFYWSLPFFALFGVLLLIFLFHQLEAVLIRDARFRLPPPAETGEDPPTLSLAGNRRASKSAILEVFAPDFGKSLYLFPLQERRRQLLAVDWIKDARLSRRWPNRIVVEIVEREPVAFVQLNRKDAAPTFKLIDADGVLLPIPPNEKFNFPVLTGIRESDAIESRRLRVKQALALLHEIGDLNAYVSEIDVRDPGNLQVVAQVDQDVVTLKLGDKNFLSRFKDFLAQYPEMRRLRPQARYFDLRIDRRIFAAEVASYGQPQ
ncbi:MAG: FtsQ-type POTRA domain-containing protein [Bryobacteraceae bacterium]|nr:FtsQ-type POTRA domain-containing protein [Bryobacteraceae bacterium]MDW8379366.1 FtsQ-type POTRA domain-containing protein [Bryobacterales bacterium]